MKIEIKPPLVAVALVVILWGVSFAVNILLGHASKIDSLSTELSQLKEARNSKVSVFSDHKNDPERDRLHVTRKKICDASLVDYDKAVEAIKVRERWMANVPDMQKTHKFHKEKLDRVNDGIHKDKFDFFGPVTPVCPRNLTRFGRGFGDDEAKYFCTTEQSHASKECVVFSIGSNNQWDFEVELHKRTSCKIHTFDCTIDVTIPKNIRDRTTFHNLCVSDRDYEREARRDITNYTNRIEKYTTLDGLVRAAGGKRPTLLKFDIEGHEFELFRQWILNADKDPDHYLPMLPDQMAFEMHYQYDKEKGYSPAELTVLGQALYRLGYVIVYRRQNPWYIGCMEFLLQRIIC